MTLSHASDMSINEALWQATNVDIAALQRIVASHFRAECRNYIRLDDGQYARAFLFSLENDMQVVARVVLPVRESLKTEAEVATMELVRARTRIPVPQVYLYCTTPHNPVRAEWILMQYMPGSRLGDCLESLTGAQKLRTGMDLAEAMSSLFQITAPQCGSLFRHGYRDDRCLQYRSLRYPTHNSAVTPSDNSSNAAAASEAHLGIGPVNDITFLAYPRQLAPGLCGPFDTEREWMEAFAFLGKPPTRKEDTESFEKALEIYDIVARFYQKSSHSTESGVFHLAHGDLSNYNILIDPDTGAVTGIVDWEMAGFRPAWLVAAGAGWFDDDSERFLVTDDQSARGNYADETPADAIIRARFRLRLAELDEKLFRHHLQGSELRALFYNCCNEYAGNTELWLEKYRDNEWSVQQRGPFPCELWADILESPDLENSSAAESTTAEATLMHD